MLFEWPTLLSDRHSPFKFSEVEEEVEIQDVTGIFDVLFSSCTVYRVSQKFVPLLYKSVFQYDWTW